VHSDIEMRTNTPGAAGRDQGRCPRTTFIQPPQPKEPRNTLQTFLTPTSPALLSAFQIETRNNRLEQQAENNGALLGELALLLERLRVPPEFASLLSGGPFEEPCMPQNMEAANWLSRAMVALDPPALPAPYAAMQVGNQVALFPYWSFLLSGYFLLTFLSSWFFLSSFWFSSSSSNLVLFHLKMHFSSYDLCLCFWVCTMTVYVYHA
jgi:hypothetical protein